MINVLKLNFNIKIGFVILLLLLFTLPVLRVNAQLQTFNFSGNDPESYQCFDDNGNTYITGDTGPNGSSVNIYKDLNSGYYLCGGFNYDGVAGNDRAVLRPPALQQIEIWFVRIIYIVWALIGSFSFLMLVGLGYQYLIRGGTSDTELVTLRKKIINFVLGFLLVFLAFPILTTVFRLLGIDNSVACYNVQMPGFQFFFTSVCTGNETLLTSACNDPSTPIESSLACSPPGLRLYCADTRVGGTLRSGLDNSSPGAASSMSFLCSTGSALSTSTRGTWTQF